MGNTEKCSSREAYIAIVNFVVASEHLRWTRFYNYLVFNTILVLAWSTVYAQSTRPGNAQFVLVLLAGLGCLSGIVWAFIGHRGSKNHDAWLREAQTLESDARQWSGDSRPCHRGLGMRDELPYPYVGAYYTLRYGPIVFSIIYILLIGASLGMFGAPDTSAVTKEDEIPMQILTLVIAAATLLVSGLVLWLEIRGARDRRRAATVWRIIDDCIAVGYERKRNATPGSALEWITRVATFCRKALGYHAQQLILQDVGVPPQIAQDQNPERIITLAQTRIHDHIAGKIVEGRIHPDFRASKWRGWTPKEVPRESASFD